MKPEAYKIQHEIEHNHFWYAGARALYRVILEMMVPKYLDTPWIMEIGCGSGGNLPLLNEFGITIGVDFSEIPLRMVPKPRTSCLVQADASRLPFASRSIDLICLLAVLEHIDNDEQVLHETARVCKKLGNVILYTSAVPFLWSHHDEGNLHKRRYWSGSLKKSLIEAGLVPICLSYQNFFTFLPTLFIRFWQRQFPQEPRFDLGDPPTWLNTFLTKLLYFEATIIRHFSLPIGVDLIALCRLSCDHTDSE